MVQLAKGSVEEVQNIKGHDYVIKLTSTLQGERSVYLSFNDEREYGKWLRKTKKVLRSQRIGRIGKPYINAVKKLG